MKRLYLPQASTTISEVVLLSEARTQISEVAQILVDTTSTATLVPSHRINFVGDHHKIRTCLEAPSTTAMTEVPATNVGVLIIGPINVRYDS
jgi:hypothetical protein